MEKTLESLYQVLQKLVGLHRQLLETVRLEKQAIIDADLAGIQEATLAKEKIIELVHAQESTRIQCIAELALELKKPAKEITLNKIILDIQGSHPKLSDMYRSSLNALSLLVSRIKEQSDYNLSLIQKSLTHIEKMKRNVLGESVPRSDTYGNKGQKVGHAQGARLVSKEA